MEVEYVLTVEDHVAFNRFQQTLPLSRRVRIRWWWLVPVVVLVGLIFLPTFFGSKPDPPPQNRPDESAWNPIIFFFLPPALVLVVVVGIFMRYRLAHQLNQVVTDPENQKRLLGWRRTSIGPEGLAVRGEEVHTTIAWAAVRKIALTQQHAFFYITTLEAIIVPRRPFGSEEEFQQFVATANDYWENAAGARGSMKSPGGNPMREPDTNITRDEDAGR